MTKYYLVLTIITLSALAEVLSKERDSQWYFTCNPANQVCDRSLYPELNLNSTEEYDSLEACNLMCDPFNTIWPSPTGPITFEKQLVQIHPSKINFVIYEENIETERYLYEITNIFTKNLYAYCGTPCSLKDQNYNVTVNFAYNSSDLTLNWETDESYTLDIATKGDVVAIQISSETVFGARHALETISQLVVSTFDHRLFILGRIHLKDEPVFPHRGLLLDTARNYMSKATILRQINGMAASKMNVLHWHATDSQSFPIVSKRVPEFSKYGAYGRDEIYTLDDIHEVVQYGLLHGVRIIMEIDAPSHAGYGWQWGPKYGLGDLAVCVNKQPWKSYCIQPPCGQVNPANKEIYRLLGKLYQDLLGSLGKVEAFHMGGDEVFIPCWNSSQEIVNYLKNQGKGVTLQDFLDVWSEFQHKATQEFDQQAGNNQSKIILWTSMLTDPNYILNYLDPNRYVIQTWVKSADPLPQRLLDLGYKLIISTKDAWYFDHGFWGNTQFYQWRKVYQNKIPNHPGVLGGEVCMWSEFVSQRSVDSRIWPRAAAAAERLWADPNTSVTAAVQSRFSRQIDRLKLLKIEVDTIWPGYCSQSVGDCFDKY